ncbi:hypothetical protein VNI00_008686 [Paramarasmius palmivorus]|uniref:Uncharacterized protein n=1 Tax=Paramarasmius palmivorus TaxID=297713 RepID=A0AAW0CWN0_9AGAR
MSFEIFRILKLSNENGDAIQCKIEKFLFKPCFTSLVEETEEVRAAVPQIEWEPFKEACLPRVDEEYLDARCSRSTAQ